MMPGISIQKELFVINADNMQLETTLTVDINPNQVLEEDGKDFLDFLGNYADKRDILLKWLILRMVITDFVGVATNMTVGRWYGVFL